MDRDLDRFLQRSLEAVSRYMHLLSYIFAWSRNNFQPVCTTIVSNVLLLRILNKSFVNPVSLVASRLVEPSRCYYSERFYLAPVFSLFFILLVIVRRTFHSLLFYLAPVFSIIWTHSLVS